MNLPTFIKCCVAACGLLALAAPASGLEPSSGRGMLKVQVNAPPSWNILLEDRVTEIFSARIHDFFSRHIPDWGVDAVRSVDQPEKLSHLLTIEVTEWRLNRLGDVDCAFIAHLQTPQGRRQLGPYSNTTIRRWTSLGSAGSGTSLENIVEGGIHSLCNDLARSELLPDFAKPSPARTA